jgi:hypothetical protein
MCSRHVRRSAFVIARCTASVGIQTLILVRHHVDVRRRSSRRSTRGRGKTSANPSTRCLPPDTRRNVFGSLASSKSRLAKLIELTLSSSALQDGDRNMHVADREVRNRSNINQFTGKIG